MFIGPCGICKACITKYIIAENKLQHHYNLQELYKNCKLIYTSDLPYILGQYAQEKNEKVLEDLGLKGLINATDFINTTTKNSYVNKTILPRTSILKHLPLLCSNITQMFVSSPDSNYLSIDNEPYSADSDDEIFKIIRRNVQSMNDMFEEEDMKNIEKSFHFKMPYVPINISSTNWLIPMLLNFESDHKCNDKRDLYSSYKASMCSILQSTGCGEYNVEEIDGHNYIYSPGHTKSTKDDASIFSRGMIGESSSLFRGNEIIHETSTLFHGDLSESKNYFVPTKFTGNMCCYSLIWVMFEIKRRYNKSSLTMEQNYEISKLYKGEFKSLYDIIHLKNVFGDDMKIKIVEQKYGEMITAPGDASDDEYMYITGHAVIGKWNLNTNQNDINDGIVNQINYHLACTDSKFDIVADIITKNYYFDYIEPNTQFDGILKPTEQWIENKFSWNMTIGTNFLHHGVLVAASKKDNRIKSYLKENNHKFVAIHNNYKICKKWIDDCKTLAIDKNGKISQKYLHKLKMKRIKKNCAVLQGEGKDEHHCDCYICQRIIALDVKNQTVSSSRVQVSTNNTSYIRGCACTQDGSQCSWKSVNSDKREHIYSYPLDPSKNCALSSIYCNTNWIKFVDDITRATYYYCPLCAYKCLLEIEWVYSCKRLKFKNDLQPPKKKTKDLISMYY